MEEVVQHRLKCPCCKGPIEEEGSIFADVLVCAACKQLAESTYRGIELELRQLLVVAKDLLRVALLRGHLRPEKGEKRNPAKADVLRQILQLKEMADARRALRCALHHPVLSRCREAPAPRGYGLSRRIQGSSSALPPVPARVFHHLRCTSAHDRRTPPSRLRSSPR